MGLVASMSIFVKQKPESEQRPRMEEKWPRSASCYRTIELMATGAQAKVYKAVRADGKICALKRMNPSTAMAEAQILSKLKHKNIMMLHAVIENEKSTYLVMDLMKTTLANLIWRKPHLFEDNSIATIAKSLLEGLHYLYLQRIIHRDIKPDNILISSKGVIKITDFGIAVHESDYNLRVAGTAPYMSPEMKDLKFSFHVSDIWSLGITLVCIINMEPHIKGPREFNTDGLRTCLVQNHASEQLTHFIEKCLIYDHRCRCNAMELLKEEYLNNSDDNCIAKIFFSTSLLHGLLK